MASEVVRPPQGSPPSAGWWSSLVGFYHGVMAEMKKVTWPDMPQVRQATIAIIIFVMLLALLIWIVDQILGGVLVTLIPSLFGNR